MRSINFLLLLLVGVLTLASCKKKDTEIHAISIPQPEDKLAGRWEIIKTEAEGNAYITKVRLPVTGYNLNEPDGYYELKKGDPNTESPNTYNYDLKVKLRLRINDAITKDFDYNDRDAGTWKIASDQKVVFYANQGNVQDIIFTRYDSSAVELLQLSVPIDTTLENIKYEGKIVLDMKKIK